jgi:Flp pilus assembly protein TadG
MKPLQSDNLNRTNDCRFYGGNKGASAVELAIILPLLVMMVFGTIDFGRLFHARQIMTNVAREGGSLASRDIQSATALLTMLQAGATPLDLATFGRIYIWKIRAGISEEEPYPSIDETTSADTGALNVASSMGTGKTNLGLNSEVYQHLVFDSVKGTADISEITVVEVFYEYRPITPVIMSNKVLSSRAVF